jgi:hypothetical protein
MPRIASITTQAFTGIAVSGGLKLIEDFAQTESQTATGVTAATGIHMGANGVNLQVVGDGIITQYTTGGAPFALTNLSADDTFDPTDNSGGAAATSSVNWDASGRNYYICESAQIEQYSIPTGDEYSITNRLAIVSNKGSFTSPRNFLIAPDDVTVLVAFGNSIAQYDIDPFFVRSVANTQATGDTLNVSNCVGAAYYDEGNSLLVASSTGTITQYELATPYSIADGTTSVSTLNTGLTLTGISVQGTSVYVCDNSNGIYRYR